MKIAIPSDDSVSISRHFGRTKGFVICNLENNKVLNQEYKENTFTGHAQGLHHDPNHEHGNHSHNGIFNAIGDCEVVIAGGMGQRLYKDFEARSIKVYVTRESTVDSALKLFIESELDNNPDDCCNH
ncbi:MAG: NifB/NifX family molybdenum-iron cluster-binding protein [Bacteroidota bacterium]